MDRIDDILKAVALLVRNGYTVTYEAPPIGKAGTGVYLHVTDEEKTNPTRKTLKW
jgi:hypothetical protein